MGKTLFWYVFKDLLKIFAMTAGTLAGIMSFGGLLRPLTQHGLDVGQVSRMLAYFSPAMLAYSLPIAALFAASVVYGRLSADNELTACRAGGISLGPVLGMAFPGVVFGLLVAVLSLAFLCFVVPTYTLKVERVIYSNLAKLIANKIERSHEIRLEDVTIFADRATIPVAPPGQTTQKVVLEGVSIVQYEKAPDKATAGVATGKPAAATPGNGVAGAKGAAATRAAALADAAGGRPARVPKEFLMASSATIDITDREDSDQVSMLIALEGGTKFPREFRGGMQAGVEAVQFGPLETTSQIKEDVKFMDVGTLRELYRNPERSRRMNAVTDVYVRRDQIRTFALDLVRRLNPRPPSAALFAGVFRYVGTIARAANVPFDPEGSGAGRYVKLQGGGAKVILSVDPTAPPAAFVAADDEVVIPGTVANTVWFERTDTPPAGAPPGTGEQKSFQSARELRLRVRPDQPTKTLHLTIELLDRSPGGAATRAVSGNYSSVIDVPMPQEVRRLANRKVAQYLDEVTLSPGDRERVRRELVVLNNNILAEAHGRGSFAVSCLILVLVGASLGMMFRSGNFLTAFAVSFIPALVCITLIVAGQQTSHAVPFQLSKGNPLNLGIALIWSGNVINAAIAGTLLWRLQRQ
jgi:lipopolysaccharide export LptBFGC system permease protein LptF